MMKNNEADILILKLEAARRQVDAAIRMMFNREDPLAIHTVGAAAYQILRDIKKQRNRSELSDRLNPGLYNLAQKIVSGELKELPDFFRGTNQLEEIVQHAVELIKSGTVADYEDFNKLVRLRHNNEKGHWAKFNLPANFLKHADRDAEEALHSSDVDNLNLLASSSASYGDIMGKLTPEMETLLCSICATDPDLGPGWSLQMDEKFRSLSNSKRRRFCLAYLRDLKKEIRSS